MFSEREYYHERRCGRPFGHRIDAKVSEAGGHIASQPICILPCLTKGSRGDDDDELE